MLQKKTPSDYVIASGENRSIRDFITQAFLLIGYEISFKGKKEREVGYISKIIKPNKVFINIIKDCKKLKINQKIIYVSKDFYRPLEVDSLLGDSRKAKKELNWIPKVKFNELVTEMLLVDIKNNVKKNS